MSNRGDSEWRRIKQAEADDQYEAWVAAGRPGEFKDFKPKEKEESER